MYDHFIKQGLLSNPVVGVEISDLKGHIRESNSSFCNMTGYDGPEITALKFSDLCHNDDKEKESYDRQLLIEGKLNHLNFRKRYRTKTGRTVWADTCITPLRDAEGGCEALMAMAVDVTKQRRQELLQQGQTHILELLYQNQALENVCTAIVESIEAVEDGLLCSILQLNTTSGTLHKLAAPGLPDFYNEAIEGMQIGTDVGSCGAAAFHKQRVVISDILNHPNWAKAQRLVKKTSLRSCWSQPIMAFSGEVLGTFAIYYTEPREPGPFELDLISSAAELAALAISHNRALAALQRSDQLKGEFISTAAHELRTPLSSIMGYAELLLQTQDLNLGQTSRSNEHLEVIISKTEMLSRIINDLFDISKIENGYCLGLQKQPTPILKVMADVVEEFEKKASEHIFCLRTEGVLPETIIADEGRITQVLNNLLSNAVKYSPDGGLVEVVAKTKSDTLNISVVDNGVGMSDEQLGRIFDKYYRVNAGDSKVQGLGLGMSISKEIVEAHGGEINVSSAPGKGTRVLFTVPNA